MSSRNIRALLVSYAFPPVGGAGVQRVLKLTKYLPEYGVTPTILTVANPSVPVFDKSLVRELRPDTEVLRARTFEPGYGLKKVVWQANAAQKPSAKRRLVGWASSVAKPLLVPDPQILWQPAAHAELLKRWAKTRDDVVFISGPPFSQFLLAAITRLSRTALVLDYRDEWSTYRNVYEMMGGLAAQAGQTLEQGTVRLAHEITTATDAFRTNLLSSFPFLDPSRVHAIPNGYDTADFPNDLPTPTSHRFVVTHAGTVFKLTSARGLLDAVRILHDREPELAKLLHVRFIGRIVDTEQAFFEGTEKLSVERIDYMEHDRVLYELSKSHLALCLLDEVPGTERIYPGKIFELMKLGRPTLTLAPNGVLRDLVLAHQLGPVLPPRNAEAIAQFLAQALRAFRQGSYKAEMVPVGIERFDRKRQAGEFADVLRRAVSRVAGSSSA